MKSIISSNIDDTKQDGSDENVDSDHELVQASPLHGASVLELDTTHSSDEESQDRDIARVSFGSPESKKKSSSKQFKRGQEYDEKFSSYFDDSSSEEDENEAEYNIITSFQGFLKSSADYKSAFYSHALGIQILRAPLVRKFYYREKEKYLKHQDETLDHQTIKDWLRKHIGKTIKEVCFNLPVNDADISMQLTEEFLKQHEEIISQLIDSIVSDRNLLFSSFNRKFDPAKRFKVAEDLLSTLYNNIRDFISEFDFENIEFAEANDFDISEIEVAEEYEELRNRIEDYLQDDIGNCMSKYTKTRAGRVAYNIEAKSGAEKKLINLPQSPCKQPAIDYIKDAIGAKSPTEVKKKIFKSALPNALKQLKDNIENDETSSLFDAVQDVLVDKGLLPLTKEGIENLVENNLENEDFLEYLFGSLQNSKKDFYRENGIERILLPEGHIFDLSNKVDFLPKFLATLNICNRSARRYLRNNGDDELERLIEEEYHRAWKFPQSDKLVTDNHKFTTKGKRNDKISGLGGYSTVLNLINGIKENLNRYKKAGVPNVTDKDIAFWIRQTLQGDKLDTLVNCNDENIEVEHYARLIKMVRFDLVKITYLLFGSEVVRNPASLIHQQMMLDLIISEKISWQDAIDSGITYQDKSDGGEMPMSMKKAVVSARILHNKFLNFMPQRYMYDPAPLESSVREEELLQREHNITEKWFNDYIGKPEPKLKYERAKIEILVEQIVRWYGIHLLWYTGDQINQLLNAHLVNQKQIVIRPTIPLIASDILTTSIFESLQRIFVDFVEVGNQAAVIPLNLGNNHWVSLVFRAEGNNLRAIYNDPLGRALSIPNRDILENAIIQAVQRIAQENNIDVVFNPILDLKLEQQTNGYDCGPITVNNLVRLALAENIDYASSETIAQNANLITNDNQDLNIRQRHSEILLMERHEDGEIIANNINRLIVLLDEERHPLVKMANLGIEDNSTSLQRHDNESEDEASDAVDSNIRP